MSTDNTINNLDKNYQNAFIFQELVDTSVVPKKITLDAMIQDKFEQLSLQSTTSTRSPSPSLTPKMHTQYKRFSSDPTESLRIEEVTNIAKQSILQPTQPVQSKQKLTMGETLKLITTLAEKNKSLSEAKTLLSQLYQEHTTLPLPLFSELLLVSSDPLWLNTLLDLQFQNTKPNIEENTKTLFPLFEEFIEKSQKNIETSDSIRLLLKIIKICYPQSTKNSNSKTAIFNALLSSIYRLPTEDRKAIKNEIFEVVNFFKKGTHDLIISGFLKQIPDALKMKYNAEVRISHKLKKDDIEKLLFSQDSIDSKTQDGTPLEELTKSMADFGWKKNTNMTIVKMPKGRLVALENRRLYAAKKVSQIYDEFVLNAHIIDHNEQAPASLIKGIRAEYKKGRGELNTEGLFKDLSIGTYGECVAVRSCTRKGDISSDTFGYPETEIRK